MRMRVYQQDIEELFDRADCPCIFSRNTKAKLSLDSIEPQSSNSELSVKAMKSVIQALIFLRQNLILPCQIKFQYIKCKGTQWGLCYAICQRNLQQKNGNVDDIDGYNPEQYQYHLDSQNQLVWNLGKVWLRFFTNQPIKIQSMNQKQINNIIDCSVSDININAMMKKLLIKDRNDRIKFQQILTYEVLVEQEKEISRYYSSLMLHLNNLSTLMMSQHGGMIKFEKKNPFIVEINYRRFREYLDINLFIESLKNDIKKFYLDGDEDQKAACKFSLHILSLQSYKNMVQLNAERLELGQRFQEITDRIYYAKFTKLMLMMKDLLQKDRKKLRTNPNLNKSLLKYLQQQADKIDQKLLYDQFKACLNEYAEWLKDDLQHDKNDLAALKLLTKIYIIRCSGYIFNQYRTQVFKPFFPNEEAFSIKKLLNRISETGSLENLRIVRSKIMEFYFKK